MIKKAVIPAGGLGTRFLPATRTQPKEMLPIIDKPVIQYVVEEAVDSGIEDILIIIGRGKDSIVNYFDNVPEVDYVAKRSNHDEDIKRIKEIVDNTSIHFIRQNEPKGLGHAISYAKTFVGDDQFAVMLGDDIIDSKVPCIKQMIDAIEPYKTSKHSIVAVEEINSSDIEKYGVISYDSVNDRVYTVKDFIEKPKFSDAPSNLAIVGRYILTPRIFDFLAKTVPGINEEIQITDAIKEMNSVSGTYHALKFEGNRYDIGSKLGYIQACIELGLKREDIGNDLKEYLSKLNL